MAQATLSSRLFNKIVDLVYGETGIRLKEADKSLLIPRLTKRIHQLGFINFSEYVNYLSSGTVGKGETEQLVHTITTNPSEFYREKHHFDFLHTAVHSILSNNDKNGDMVLRIWSASCSTGEEPYTIAMTIKALVDARPNWRVQILASDVDSQSLSFATRGIFDQNHLIGISQKELVAHFSKISDSPKDIYKINSDLRKMVVFQQINLINHSFRFKAPLDLVFCRNVLVYFDESAKHKLLRKLSKAIRSGGYLIIGHADSLPSQVRDFKLFEGTIYQKI